MPSRKIIKVMPHIMCYNVRSALNMLDDITATISSRRVQVFAATETWFHDEINEDCVRIPNFHQQRCDRRSRRGGGVCVWTHFTIDAELLVTTDKPDFLDAVWLSFPKSKIIFACLYVPPDFSITHRCVINDYIICSFDMLFNLCDFD